MHCLTDSEHDMAHASSPIHAYALVWASHTLLQLCVQPFLFPLGLRSIICVANGALVLRPSRRTFTAALLLRNLARAVSAPFVWDSEFWLALTDAVPPGHFKQWSEEKP